MVSLCWAQTEKGLEGRILRGSSYVALKSCSLSMSCMIYRSFRRSRTYSRSISGYMATHSNSLCINADCGLGVINVADSPPDRGANMGIVILVGMKEHYVL